MEDFLKIFCYLAFMTCGFAIMAKAVWLYRFTVVPAMVIVFVEMGLESGVGFVAAGLGVIFVVIPVLLMVVARLTMGILWNDVRQTYPNEPITPPCTPMSLLDAYKVMWLAD